MKTFLDLKTNKDKSEIQRFRYVTGNRGIARGRKNWKRIKNQEGKGKIGKFYNLTPPDRYRAGYGFDKHHKYLDKNYVFTSNRVRYGTNLI